MAKQTDKVVRRKRRSRRGGVSTPKTTPVSGPWLYFLPLLVVATVGYVLFRPDPNVIDDPEDERVAKLLESYSSDPNSGIADRVSRSDSSTGTDESDRNKTRTVTGTVDGEQARIELVSLQTIDRHREPTDFSNPLVGYWKPGAGYGDVEVRLRFTRTFICEIYVVNDPSIAESANYNLRKLGEVPYSIDMVEKPDQWESLSRTWSIPRFELSIQTSFQNRDGTIGTARIPVECQLVLNVEGDRTPGDVDDFIRYYLRSADFNRFVLTRTLAEQNINQPLNTVWERKVEADWRDGVDPSQF